MPKKKDVEIQTTNRKKEKEKKIWTTNKKKHKVEVENITESNSPFSSLNNRNIENNSQIVTETVECTIQETKPIVTLPPLLPLVAIPPIMVESEKYENIRLTIDKEGKVAAALDVPLTTLPTAELKILSNLLSCVQNSIKSLNFPPGINLNKIVRITCQNKQRTECSIPLQNKPGEETTHSTNDNINADVSYSSNNHITLVKSSVQPKGDSLDTKVKLSMEIKHFMKYFSLCTETKNNVYTNSFEKFLNSQVQNTENTLPVIQDVCSLQLNSASKCNMNNTLSTLDVDTSNLKQPNTHNTTKVDTNLSHSSSSSSVIKRKASPNKEVTIKKSRTENLG